MVDGGDGGDQEVLAGGVANAGAVVRVGDTVLRPAGPHRESIHALLQALTDTGFDGASEPLGVEPDGRERLRYIDGDVPVPPYPEWAQADDVLASVARLIRRFHDAARAFDPAGHTWSNEMADPEGGTLVVHNDVCLENVVFRDGEAVALLDFDFAAPGRPEYDLAAFARMCVPIDDDVNATRLGWRPADRPARLRLVADAYRLDEEGRGVVLACLDDAVDRAGEFVRRRVEAGDPNFIRMWEGMGGQERFDRRRRWWLENRHLFASSMGAGPG